MSKENIDVCVIVSTMQQGTVSEPVDQSPGVDWLSRVQIKD